MHPDISLAGMETLYLWRLLAAVVLGTLVGLERSIVGKHAGMRTYALVSLGSCVFSIVSTVGSYQFSLFNGTNPMQIASSVVIGVGFIGAGLAAARSDTHVELTTASGIWVAAAIGMACGFGLLTTAVATTVLVIITFVLMSRLERWLRATWGSAQ